MRKSTAIIVAIWGAAFAFIFPIFRELFRETYWALVVEGFLDRIAAGLGIQRSAMTDVILPLVAAGTVVGLACYATLWVARRERAKEAKKEAPAAAIIPANLPPRDVSLVDVIWRVYTGAWDSELREVRRGDTDQEVKFFDACAEIRQAAFDGKLPIWASRRGNDLYEYLPPSYWLNREIVDGIHRSPEVTHVWIKFTYALEVGQVPNARSPEWQGHMTNKAKVDEIWPPKP